MSLTSQVYIFMVDCCHWVWDVAIGFVQPSTSLASQVHILMVNMLALGLRCCCWIWGISVGWEPPAVFISPWLTCWHWVQDIEFRHVGIGFKFKSLASSSIFPAWVLIVEVLLISLSLHCWCGTHVIESASLQNTRVQVSMNLHGSVVQGHLSAGSWLIVSLHTKLRFPGMSIRYCVWREFSMCGMRMGAWSAGRKGKNEFVTYHLNVEPNFPPLSKSEPAHIPQERGGAQVWAFMSWSPGLVNTYSISKIK